MKKLTVVAAAIIKDGKVLVAKKAKDMFFEFPGGKIEEGETLQQAIVREISEELKAEISVDRVLCSSTHQYSDFIINMTTLICTLISNEITLTEHVEALWADYQTLKKLQFHDADLYVVDSLKKIIL